MSTITATTQFSPNLKSVHTGMIHTGAAVAYGATLTAASVVKLVQVPDGATLLDWWAYIAQAGANQVVNIGTSATPSGIASGFSLSAVAAASGGVGAFRNPHGNLLPARISLSDDASPQSVWVEAKLDAAVSASLAFNFNLFYTMDGTAAVATIR